MGGEGEELDGEVAGVGAEDETAFVEVDEAEEERGAATDSVESGLVGAVGREGVVVSVEDGDGSRGDEGVHGGGLLGVGTDGEEALPVDVAGGGTGAVVVQAGGGDLDGFDDGGGGDAGLVHGGGGRDDGDDFDGVAGGDGSGGGGEVEREDVFDVEMLGGEDAVEAFEREGTLVVKEVGNVGLLEACLLGETGSGEGTTLDTAEELETEEFVEVIEVHGVRLSPGGTISFDKTKIRRKLCLQQHILFVNYSFRVIYGTELPEERLLLTQSLSKAITLKLSILGIR